MLCFEWKIAKFENVRIFKYYKILIKSSKKERNHYDLKEMENIKNSKIVSIPWHHNVLTEKFSNTEKSAFLYEKVEFLTSPTQVVIIVCC